MPPAVQAAAAVQETPVSELPFSASGFGVGAIVQPVPFQLSASGCPSAVALAFVKPPTATHASGAVHEIELSEERLPARATASFAATICGRARPQRACARSC